MAPSVTGPLRTRIGQVKARLNLIVNATPPMTIVFGPDWDHDQKEDYLERKEIELKKSEDNLKLAIADLEKLHGEWQEKVEAIPVEARDAEWKLYEDALAKNDSFLVSIDKARESLIQISADKQEARRLLRRLNGNSAAASQAGDDDHEGGVSSPHVGLSNRRIKLPEYKMDPYDGDPLKWSIFAGTYCHAIHDNPNLNNHDRMTYLLSSCLTGKALRTVAGFRNRPDDYSDAWRLLKETYGDEGLVKRALYRQLRALTPRGDLRSTVTELEVILRQLESMKEDLDHPQTVVQVESLLPHWVISKVVEKKVDNTNWSLADLRQYLAKLVKINEEAKEIMENSTSKPHVSSPHGRRRTETALATDEATLVAYDASASVTSKSSHVAQKNPSGQCFCCAGAHWSADCRKYPTAQKRRYRLIELGRCTKCLRKADSHDVKRCVCKKLCTNCKDYRHYLFLCPKKFPDSSQGPTRDRGDSQRKDPRGRTAKTTTTLNAPEEKEEIPKADLESSESESSEEESIPDPDRPEENDVEESVNCQSDVAPTTTHKSTVLMTKVLPMSAKPTSEIHMTPSLFDGGSTNTYITRKYAELIGVRPEREVRRYGGVFNSSERVVRTMALASVTLHFIGGATITMEVGIVDHITPSLKFLHVETLPVEGTARWHAKSSRKTPHLLIGADYLYEIVDYSTIMKLPNGCLLINSRVGLIATGPVNARYCNFDNADVVAVIQGVTPEPDVGKIEDRCDNFWSLEAAGILDCPGEKDDEIAVKLFRQNIVYDSMSKRYVIQWAWKPNRDKLSDNFRLCLSRLDSLLRQLNKNKEELKRKYHEILMDWLRLGYIELVKRGAVPTGPVTYLPHRPHVTPHKLTTKVRPVKDASAKPKGGYSLNDCLYRGPNKIPQLVGVVLRIRGFKILLSGDIEKAFLQIALAEESRDCTRFLWVRDPNLPPRGNNLVVYRFARVLFGVIQSPFVLNETNQCLLEENPSPTAEKLKENLYVDNAFIGSETVEEAIQHYQVTKSLFQKASMNIRDFISNDPKVNCHIPEEDRLKHSNLSLLGMDWDTVGDTLSIRLPTPNPNVGAWTKRLVLQFIGKNYDPIGRMAPLLFLMKLFLQKLWAKGLGWDEHFGEDLAKEWSGLIDWSIDYISFPRRYSTPVTESELHVYTDASENGCGAVAYLRGPGKEELADDESNHDICFVMAKTRIAPLKPKLTIPRLELYGMVIGARLATFIKEQLRYDGPIYLWTDNKPVLGWLNSPEKTKERWVDNRVRSIRTNAALQNAEFGHVAGVDNPADLASRGASMPELVSGEKGDLWLQGPAWLKTDRQQWPTQPAPLTRDPNEAEEDILVLDSRPRALSTPEFELIKVSNFSSLLRLLMTVSTVLRFLGQRILSHVAKRGIGSPLLKRIRKLRRKGTTDLCELAELLMVKQAQSQYYWEADLRRYRTSKDETGLIWCHFRLPDQENDSDVGIKSRLIYLPRLGPLTRLIVENAHRQAHHAGVSFTLAKVRDKYWIPRGRQLVKSIVDACPGCRLWKAKQFKLPNMEQQRINRTHRWAPFTYTGIDYLGPVKFTLPSGSLVKSWVCVFTCYTTRLSHLEPILDMSAKGFLNALRRFVGRRGVPRQITCDNARQFTLAAKTMESASWFDDDSLVAYSE